MSDEARRARGLSALEAAGLLGGAPAADRGSDFEVDGHPLGDCPAVRPADGEALGRSLGILNEHHMTALIRGGGSRLDLGNRPGRLDVVLETSSLAGVSDFERDDGVVCVHAGTPISRLRELVGAEGWVLRLDPPGAAATVGGTLASGAIGPRVLKHGRPRDCVLGLDVVLASGERTTCGGRVVKNVTGYDIAKLYTGSLGTLGVIASAWLRLAPIPELRQLLVASSSNFENMFAMSLEASRRSTARVAALLSPRAARAVGAAGHAEVSAGEAEDRWVLLLELAGDELATRGDAAWLVDRAQRLGGVGVESEALEEPAGAAEDPTGPIDRLRALQGGTLEAHAVRARIAALPSALPAIVDAITDKSVGLVLHPGVGLIYAFSGGGREAQLAAIEAYTRAAASHGGSVVLEALPPAVKLGRDVFGDLGPELALMRALKQRFDPRGVLNPGRFAGGI